MNTRPDFRKPCYKCGNMTAVTAEEMHNGQKSTTCEPCKVKLSVELGAVEWNQPPIQFPKDEAQPSSPPPAVSVP